MLTPSTILFVISIHDLTRRSTLNSLILLYVFIISIHDLTRRSTQINADHLADFNISIHDLTRRSTVFDRPLSRLRTHFNSRPHKEVDRIFYMFQYP